MPLTLVQLLAARGLAQGDLQAAEARRVKLGGGLETSLLELGILQEARVGELWSEASRLPRPPPELLKEVTAAMASLFPQQLAERYGMVPLGLVRRQLSLLAKHPVDLSTVDEISFLLSRPLKLFVGTELEIAELLGVVYGVVVPQRLKELRLKLTPGATGTVEEVVAPASVPAEGATPIPNEDATTGGAGGPAGAVSNPTSTSTQDATTGGAGGPAGAVSNPTPTSTPTEDETPTPTAQPPVAPASVPALHATPVAPASSPEPADGSAEEEEEPVSIESALASMAEKAHQESVASAAAPEPEPLILPPKRSLSPEPWSINLPLREPASASSRTQSQPPAPVQAAVVTEVPESRDPSPQTSPVRGEGEPQWSSAPELAAATPQPSPVQEEVVPQPSPLREEKVPSAEPSPFEATPMGSGYGARLGQEHRMSAGEAMAALREEQTRDGVIGVAVDFLRGAFDFVAVFVRKDETFQVFEATGIEYGGGADLTQTIVDVDRSRVLRTVVEGKAPYVGPIPPGDPLEGALGALGRGRLRAVLMYPIVIRDRTIAVVHGDRGGEALAPRQLSDVALVLSQLGAQLERVIRERRKVKRTVPIKRAPFVAPVPVAVAPAVAEIAAAPPAPLTPALSPLRGEGVQESDESAPARTPELLKAPEPPEVESAPARRLELPGGEGALKAPPPPPPPEAFDMSPPSDGEEFDASRAEDYEIRDDQEPFEIPVEWVDETQGGSMSDHVRAFLSGDPPARARAADALRTGGEDAAWALAERFPGPLFVFRMTIDELPAPEAMGTLIGMLASLGPAALPALSNLTESPNEERRFWSTMLLAKIGDQSAVPVLARRLLDPSPDVNHAARRGLWRLRKAPEFAVVLAQATDELRAADAERAIPLIQALGQFHHVPAIPMLIGMLASRDPQISQAAVEGLREISRQDFSTSERRWTAWWEQAKGRPRLHWVIDALEDRDRDLRLAAISELTELTGFDLGYQSDLDPGRQAPALARWREWLERDGRSRTPLPFPSAG